jgi:hypothetical protein
MLVFKQLLTFFKVCCSIKLIMLIVVMLSVTIVNFVHGQTLANRTKPGPSLQVEKWLCLCYLLIFLLSKAAYLKVENSAQTTLCSLPLDISLPASWHPLGGWFDKTGFTSPPTTSLSCSSVPPNAKFHAIKLFFFVTDHDAE